MHNLMWDIRLVVKLNETIVFFKMMVQLKDEGTTKRGRVDANISKNSSS